MRITIDPGIGGTGWAIWNKNWLLKSWGIIIPKGKVEHEKITNICLQLQFICYGNMVKEVYIEYPQVFRTDIALSGALTKLGFAVGMITGCLLPRKFELIEVTKWKGQLPKEVVAKRIRKILPNKKIDSHAYDAVGIGLYKRGDF